MISFPLCYRVKGAQWSCAALPGPAMAPGAWPVAPEPVSAPLGIPGPPATPGLRGPLGKPSPGNPKQSWVCPGGTAVTRAGGGLAELNWVPQAASTGGRGKRCSQDPPNLAPRRQLLPMALHPVPGRDILLVPRG